MHVTTIYNNMLLKFYVQFNSTRIFRKKLTRWVFVKKKVTFQYPAMEIIIEKKCGEVAVAQPGFRFGD